MPAIDVVSDANVALKWFLDADEEEVEPSRELLDLQRERRVLLHVLDLTLYEVGNVLLRGRAGASAEQAAAVTDALRDICAVVSPTTQELALACDLAAQHALTLYDAAYVAVAMTRRARLVTLDGALLGPRLGCTPSQLVQELAAGG